MCGAAVVRKSSLAESLVDSLTESVTSFIMSK